MAKRRASRTASPPVSFASRSSGSRRRALRTRVVRRASTFPCAFPLRISQPTTPVGPERARTRARRKIAHRRCAIACAPEPLGPARLGPAFFCPPSPDPERAAPSPAPRGSRAPQSSSSPSARARPRCQVPLVLAWNITVHKSQGSTLPEVIVKTENAFAAGQV
eukprot:5670857-Prymnesium_polylepis.1